MQAPILCLGPDDRGFPPALEHVTPAPEALWLRGQERWLQAADLVAVVGTRSPTPYGLAQARRFATAIAARGGVVVSGMARGIDQAAHRAALDAGGGTIAVLGSGVDRPWPRDPIAGELAAQGLLLSEYAPGQAPRRHHFPLRNRLISGLARGVLVVEAAYASGSLITARWAVEQGREVWALPGRVDQPMAHGTHRLLREGAILVEHPDELFTGERLDGACAPHESTSTDPIENALIGETATVDELAQRTRRPVDEVLARLAQLELDRRVVRAPGGLYRLAIHGG
ncbi:MAG: DNA-processing protein DprA [Planctomycetota bacterium]